MSRVLIAASILFVAAEASAQPPQQPRQAPSQQRISPQEQARLRQLGGALATCHGQIVRRDARSPLTAAQIVERALAGCTAPEAAIRNAMVRHMGAARAAEALTAQRTHWRQSIAQMVARARAPR